jgi:nitrogen regulatory protein P-II 1
MSKKTNELIVLTDVMLITVVVQRGVADQVVQVAVEAGAQGATVFSCAR